MSLYPRVSARSLTRRGGSFTHEIAPHITHIWGGLSMRSSRHENIQSVVCRSPAVKVKVIVPLPRCILMPDKVLAEERERVTETKKE